MFTTPAVGVGEALVLTDGVSVGRSVGSGPSVGAVVGVGEGSSVGVGWGLASPVAREVQTLPRLRH